MFGLSLSQGYQPGSGANLRRVQPGQTPPNRTHDRRIIPEGVAPTVQEGWSLQRLFGFSLRTQVLPSSTESPELTAMAQAQSIESKGHDEPAVHVSPPDWGLQRLSYYKDQLLQDKMRVTVFALSETLGSLQKKGLDITNPDRRYASFFKETTGVLHPDRKHTLEDIPKFISFFNQVVEDVYPQSEHLQVKNAFIEIYNYLMTKQNDKLLSRFLENFAEFSKMIYRQLEIMSKEPEKREQAGESIKNLLMVFPLSLSPSVLSETCLQGANKIVVEALNRSQLVADIEDVSIKVLKRHKLRDYHYDIHIPNSGRSLIPGQLDPVLDSECYAIRTWEGNAHAAVLSLANHIERMINYKVAESLKSLVSVFSEGKDPIRNFLLDPVHVTPCAGKGPRFLGLSTQDFLDEDAMILQHFTQVANKIERAIEHPRYPLIFQNYEAFFDLKTIQQLAAAITDPNADLLSVTKALSVLHILTEYRLDSPAEHFFTVENKRSLFIVSEFLFEFKNQMGCRNEYESIYHEFAGQMDKLQSQFPDVITEQVTTLLKVNMRDFLTVNRTAIEHWKNGIVYWKRNAFQNGLFDTKPLSDFRQVLNKGLPFELVEKHIHIQPSDFNPNYFPRNFKAQLFLIRNSDGIPVELFMQKNVNNDFSLGIQAGEIRYMLINKKEFSRPENEKKADIVIMNAFLNCLADPSHVLHTVQEAKQILALEPWVRDSGFLENYLPIVIDNPSIMSALFKFLIQAVPERRAEYRDIFYNVAHTKDPQWNEFKKLYVGEMLFGLNSEQIRQLDALSVCDAYDFKKWVKLYQNTLDMRESLMPIVYARCLEMKDIDFIERHQVGYLQHYFNEDGSCDHKKLNEYVNLCIEETIVISNEERHQDLLKEKLKAVWELAETEPIKLFKQAYVSHFFERLTREEKLDLSVFRYLNPDKISQLSLKNLKDCLRCYRNNDWKIMTLEDLDTLATVYITCKEAEGKATKPESELRQSIEEHVFVQHSKHLRARISRGETLSRLDKEWIEHGIDTELSGAQELVDVIFQHQYDHNQLFARHLFIEKGVRPTTKMASRLLEEQLQVLIKHVKSNGEGCGARYQLNSDFEDEITLMSDYGSLSDESLFELVIDLEDVNEARREISDRCVWMTQVLLSRDLAKTPEFWRSTEPTFVQKLGQQLGLHLTSERSQEIILDEDIRAAILRVLNHERDATLLMAA